MQQGQWPFPENDAIETKETQICGDGDKSGSSDEESQEEDDDDDLFVNTNRPQVEQSQSEDSSDDNEDTKT